MSFSRVLHIPIAQKRMPIQFSLIMNDNVTASESLMGKVLAKHVKGRLEPAARSHSQNIKCLFVVNEERQNFLLWKISLPSFILT